MSQHEGVRLTFRFVPRERYPLAEHDDQHRKRPTELVITNTYQPPQRWFKVHGIIHEWNEWLTSGER